MSTDDMDALLDDENREPTQEEIAAAFVQRLGRVPVRDIIMQTMATLSDVAGIRLGLGPEGDDVKDIAQAKLAIEGFRALLVVADQEIGTAVTRPFREPMAQLQMAYAQIAEGKTQEDDASPEPPPEPTKKLWTPGS
jgi:hypothetical protein